jgi:carboxyl-terminal processing protease
MKLILRAFLITVTVTTLLVTTFFAGYLYRDIVCDKLDFPILFQSFEILMENGLKEPPPKPALEYGMIQGMLQVYDDPYTVFVEPVQHELETNSLQGEFGGIGANLGVDPEGNWILYPFPESPADVAGIKEGDRLLIVDDFFVSADTPLDSIQAAIRGPVGQLVILTIGRAPDYSPVKIKIKREVIPLPTVTWHLDPGELRLGVIEINLIASSTASEIQLAIEELKDRGASHFILDIRNNPGGLLTAGVEIAKLFLNTGIVMQQQYRGEEIEIFRVETPGRYADIPIAVFINQNSASAAEIIAGALQVHHRAHLIGVPSFGKDTIQLVFDLNDGSSLHVTAAQWWIPGLNSPVHENGLRPDITVENQIASRRGDPYIQAAIHTFFDSE